MSGPIVQKAVQEALRVAKEEYPELDKDDKKIQELTEAATAIANTVVNQTPASGEQLVKIEQGLQLYSYRLNFRQEGGQFYSDITAGGGNRYLDSIKLDTTNAFESVSGLQIASIVVEVVALILSIVGITVPEEKIAQVAKSVAKALLDSPAVKAAIAALKKAFSSVGSGSGKAEAVWNLIKAVWEYRKQGNIIIKIVKGLLSGLSWWKIAKIVAEVTAMLVAAFASGGAALIAKILLALKSAYEFAKKISNLNELDEIRERVLK